MSRKVKREIIEWSIVIGLPLFLIATGKHTEVLGQIQRLVLMPGIIQPDIDLPEEQRVAASYDLTLIDPQGNSMKLSSFKGKAIFLNFWASWCAPCIAEMPDIEHLYENVDSEQIEFVLVSLDEDAEKAWNFVERKSLTVPVYQTSGALPSLYRTGSIPSTFIISPEGRIVSKRVGMAKYNTARFRTFLLNL